MNRNFTSTNQTTSKGNTMKYIRLSLLGLIAAATIPTMAPARTKLVTLPDRAKMVTSLENPSFTLLYEEREIPLQKGTNFVDFAWTGVSIDSRSVMIEMLSHPGDGDEATKIIATGFPPNENALTWQVYSPEARTERIRVSYILYGISQYASYEVTVNQDETEGDLRQYLHLQNQSGENLDNTVIRIPQMDDLSRSVDSGEVRRFLAQRNRELPIEKLYISRPGYSSFRGEDGEEVKMVYEIENSEESGLGKGKLPNGKVRLYGDDGMDSSIFLGEDMLSPTPPKEKGELTLGTVKDVVLKRRLMNDERTNERRNKNRSVVLFDQIRELRYEIENFKDQPVTLKIYESLNGDWSIEEITRDGVTTEKKSLNELLITIELEPTPAGTEPEKKIVDVEFLVKNRFPNES